MKVLIMVQWTLELMGYSSKQHRFNIKLIRRGFEAMMITIFYYAYLFHDADTIHEYAFAIFMTFSTTCIFLSFVSTVNETATMFNLIEKIENVLNEGN